MSSTASHFIIGAALALPGVGSRELTGVLQGWQISVGAGLLAALPDADFLAIRAFGIPYESLFAHRGFFHSPFFLILFAAAVAGIVTRGHSRNAFATLWLVWAGCMVTHPLLDAMTNGGRGVMLLLPFTQARFFLPWRPLATPPAGIGSFLPGASFLNKVSFIRPSELPFCVGAAVTGVAGLLARERHLAGDRET